MQPVRLPIALPEVEGTNAIDFVRTLQHLWMAQRTNGVIIAGMPVFLHGPAGELVVLCDAFICLCVIDQVKVVWLSMRANPESLASI